MFWLKFASVTILYLNVVFSVRNAHSQTDTVIRQTQYGPVAGILTGLCQKFLGVPFASPAKRWASPEDPVPWSGILNATAVKPMCFQGANCPEVNPEQACLPDMSEDCLYLNIYTPASADERSRYAVMIFFHGGGFEFSSGGAEVYNGEKFVNIGEVVLVTINYRLGAFGYLTTGDGPDDIRGNYGLEDQKQAIKWVSKNINYFGGDENRVTLFGQSAGALSIAIHMTTGQVDNMFHRVIMQSSPFTIPLKPMKVAIRQGNIFANLLACPPKNANCLRSRSALEIAEKQGEYFQQVAFSDSYLRKFLPWIPHIDGKEVPAALMDAFNNKSYTAKPTLIGTVSQEGDLYVPLAFGRPLDKLEYSMLLFGIAPLLAQKTLENYHPRDQADARPELAVLVTDFMFACPARSIARRLSNEVPVFTYVFHNILPFKNIWGISKQCEYTVCHGAEIPYLFQPADYGRYNFSGKELELSNSMIHYWTTFAKTGSPNMYGHFGSQIWTPYSQQGSFPDISMVLNAEKGSFLTQNYRGRACDFWDQVEYRAKK